MKYEVLAGLLAVLLLGAPCRLSAGQLAVTNTENSGSGSLSEALSSAAPGDTVYFNIPGNDTIIRSYSTYLDEDITITGPNRATGQPVVIQVEEPGETDRQLFSISDCYAIFRKLVLRGGHQVRGGCLRIYGDSTRAWLDSVTVCDSRSNVAGGGIYNKYASLTVTNSTIRDNYAHADWVSNSTTDIYATCNGGGICNDSGSVYLMNCTISGNIANASVNSYAISDDGPTRAYGYGGGIYSYYGQLTMINCTVNGNRSLAQCNAVSSSSVWAHSAGGGVYANNTNADNVTDILNCTICSNVTSSYWDQYHQNGGNSYGAGIVLGSKSSTVVNTIITANTSSKKGSSSATDLISTGATHHLVNVVMFDSAGYNYTSIYTQTGVTAAEIFLTASPRLEDLGGPTQTIGIPDGSCVQGAGVLAGHISVDVTDSNGTSTVSRTVYYDGTDWRRVDTDSVVTDTTTLVKITADQRGEPLEYPPSLGSFAGDYVSTIRMDVSGTVDTNTTWCTDTVKVTGDVTVPDGITLIIDPGTYVVFQGHYAINIQGRLLAVGTASEIIQFTAADTAAGWHGIRFDQTPETNDTSRLAFCRLRYGRATGSGDDACGGAIFVDTFSKLTVSHTTIRNSSASGMYSGGGAVYCHAASVTFSDISVLNNKGGWYGGGIYCEGAQPRLTNAALTNNLADYGGGIYIKGSSPVIDNLVLTDNTAVQGAGMFCTEASPVITGGAISNNEAPGATGYGGGIYCGSGSSPRLSGIIMTGNKAADGGGIFSTNSSPLLYNMVLSRNHAFNGGGISLINFSSVSVINTTIALNRATLSYGGGIFCRLSELDLTNSIMWYNTSSLDSDGIYLDDDASDPDIFYCNIQGGSAGFNGAGADTNYKGTYSENMDLEPMSADTAENDFRLLSGSPCINAGTPDTAGLGLPEYDLDGNPRIFGSGIDMGAYEFQGTGILHGQVPVSVMPVWEYGSWFNLQGRRIRAERVRVPGMYIRIGVRGPEKVIYLEEVRYQDQ